ncbi:MAG: hypothetical protein AVDCRST_MAG76-2769 [uncultured Acidimicrobiales bacterium]|uniref:HPr kinase/phosphorylase C-terminal domain-containing protein n=1 Tax=uncultured Acidimicrobiales bacterium TaxID=310071 RepID=A0A6J4IRE1_9ACTN|nr:MAG: hypothetical protein AVDCRST_MAG76-2769 [uncultured Acidimicrobiales bacterium]
MTDQPPVAVYGLHGLRLRSPLPLAGFILPGGEHDVDLTWAEGGPVPADPGPGRLVVARATDDGLLYVGVDDGATLTLRVPTLCDFVIDHDLHAVEARLDPGADPRLVALLVSGLLVAFLLSIGGALVLHASAVEVDGRGLAFAGASGAGKSTLAALLCGAGARLVTDDVLRVATTPGPMCVGGTPQLRLRPRGAWALDGFRLAPPTKPTVDHRLAVAPPASGDHQVPLALVVLPRVSRTATRLEVLRVTGADAVVRLAGTSRVVGWRDPSVTRQQFRATSELAGKVAVVEATIPWGPRLTAATVAALLGEAGARG